MSGAIFSISVGQLQVSATLAENALTSMLCRPLGGAYLGGVQRRRDLLSRPSRQLAHRQACVTWRLQNVLPRCHVSVSLLCRSSAGLSQGYRRTFTASLLELRSVGLLCARTVPRCWYPYVDSRLFLDTCRSGNQRDRQKIPTKEIARFGRCPPKCTFTHRSACKAVCIILVGLQSSVHYLSEIYCVGPQTNCDRT